MNIHHRINYIEYKAPDLEKIKTFYTKAFRWSFTDYGPSYVAFSDGSLDGGFEKGDVNNSSSPLVILYSENLDKSISTITGAGGKIVKPTYSFPGGKRFHFSDPAGNELAVWSEE